MYRGLQDFRTRIELGRGCLDMKLRMGAVRVQSGSLHGVRHPVSVPGSRGGLVVAGLWRRGLTSTVE